MSMICFVLHDLWVWCAKYTDSSVGPLPEPKNSFCTLFIDGSIEIQQSIDIGNSVLHDAWAIKFCPTQYDMVSVQEIRQRGGTIISIAFRCRCTPTVWRRSRVTRYMGKSSKCMCSIGRRLWLNISAEIQESPSPEALPIAALCNDYHLLGVTFPRSNATQSIWSWPAAIGLLSGRSIELIQGNPRYKAMKDADLDEVAEQMPFLLSKQEVDRNIYNILP